MPLIKNKIKDEKRKEVNKILIKDKLTNNDSAMNRISCVKAASTDTKLTPWKMKVNNFHLICLLSRVIKTITRRYENQRSL